MPDLLVNLLQLPSLEPQLEQLSRAEIIVRRAQPFEISKVRSFITENFSTAWADEISFGFAAKPVTVYIATMNRTVVGFAAYECTRRAFFGPTGVVDSMRGRGLGKVLLMASLHGLRELGYAYGIIGGAGPVEFYQKTVGAVVIADSDPGIYTDLLE